MTARAVSHTWTHDPALLGACGRFYSLFALLCQRSGWLGNTSTTTIAPQSAFAEGTTLVESKSLSSLKDALALTVLGVDDDVGAGHAA